MLPIPRDVKEYHVFLASPGDVSVERQRVREFFARFNQTATQLWQVRFQVIDWENYSTIGVGRPQELITAQTLTAFRQSLALFVGILAQRFGSPTGVAESGTEEEFLAAREFQRRNGFPEIKWFFRKFEKLEFPTDPDAIQAALTQWQKVQDFRKGLQNAGDPIFFAEYSTPDLFRDVFEADLTRWLMASDRPWIPARSEPAFASTLSLAPPTAFYTQLEQAFRRLDIAGIDNDRAFEIPLSEIYVRLRVMFEEDAQDEQADQEAGALDIQTALLRYRRLVIVGDPGSGKSTFLKYIALMLARSFLQGNAGLALEKLNLPEPLPIPIFVSCWDLSNFLSGRPARLNLLVDFLAEHLTAEGFPITVEQVRRRLQTGQCCLLFDGLDEVPTDSGRAAVSRLLEDCVQEYGDNRFVVTSRVRAYTGDTILKGNFTRCDIQPFDEQDRAAFVRNWVALLFRIPPDSVQAPVSPALREYTDLIQGIETSDRIRSLAVNPLLLTVIAIVHWNRKRLPEQRVDLYDECVDVLLGQRKEAERTQYNRLIPEQRYEQGQHEERAWVRKRFAEIALHILCQDGDHDEATKADVIQLLTPRFIDQGAIHAEQAATRAELFLERQELRSGLLVSRRAQSYRFVHLTFQEFLGAWHLSNKEFEDAKQIVQPRLRLAKWFETLQLLGALWAKESDDTVDRYVAWLLSQWGNTINERAPIVALSANIAKDIRGVAQLKTTTTETLRKAVEATLDAFRRGSGVSPKTQVEILEALGQLGAAVKSHLMDATRASLFQVRRRAIEMLLPHLSDEELFGMTHILGDASREPIASYMSALLSRDHDRTLRLVIDQKTISSRCGEGILRAWPPAKDEATRRMFVHMATLPWADYEVRALYLKVLAQSWPDSVSRELLAKRAIEDGTPTVRATALSTLAARDSWADKETRTLLARQATEDNAPGVRSTALSILAARDSWADEEMRALLIRRAIEDSAADVRSAALTTLAARDSWADEETRALLVRRASEDSAPDARATALGALAARDSWADEKTLQLVLQRLPEETTFRALHTIQNALARRGPWVESLKGFIRSAPTSNARGLAACIWFLKHGGAASDLKRRIFSRDADGVPPFVDPFLPVKDDHLSKVMQTSRSTGEKVSEAVDEMSVELGWDLRKGFKP